MPHPTRAQVEKFLNYYEHDLSDEDAADLINEEYSDLYTDDEIDNGAMDQLFVYVDHYRKHGVWPDDCVLAVA